MQFAMFSEYTLAATFLNGSCAFQCSNQKAYSPCVFSGDEDQGLDQLYAKLIDNQH